jgi:hypothetical protein
MTADQNKRKKRKLRFFTPDYKKQAPGQSKCVSKHVEDETERVV